ncbi:hypothetical protein JSQ81_13965 [Sporosarcina sp. Marseille-Q4063]|uniref:hypothetical protein n=1 Tax=Sporosarcina sp. Marseille-Q4063 TaxID=2810514 RepID=UPI001BAE8E4A|nr:hypothetical protein [Sporosarcina sp. Marseille-Q4063]QUW20916.1 hypothetical protein JSQ81_13965 [Sporosarcina sp. Marseille-Q4063]
MKRLEILTSHTSSTEFLRDAKKLISSGKKDFIKRTYYDPEGKRVRWIEALLEIGLTEPAQVWDQVLDLTTSDYHEGPCLDTDRPQDGNVIWIFKKEINDVLTYVKLKIDRRGCVCLSFHEDW